LENLGTESVHGARPYDARHTQVWRKGSGLQSLRGGYAFNAILFLKNNPMFPSQDN
jgi:hypothetical protein